MLRLSARDLGHKLDDVMSSFDEDLSADTARGVYDLVHVFLYERTSKCHLLNDLSGLSRPSGLSRQTSADASFVRCEMPVCPRNNSNRQQDVLGETTASNGTRMRMVISLW